MAAEIQNETFIELADMAAWEDFWSNNKDDLLEIADKQTCFDLVCNCSLIVGGGASPLFRVGFVD